MSNQMLPMSGNYGNLGNAAQMKDGLRDRFRGWLGMLSRHARVLVVAGLVVVASVAPSIGVGRAEARVLYTGSLGGSLSMPMVAVPARIDPSSRGGARSTQLTQAATMATPDISTPDKFIAAVSVPAQDSQAATGVPASVTIAQAILESEWGRSELSAKAQNYFGIKAGSGPGPAGEISMDTWEVSDGRNVVLSDAFKAYHNLYESVMDHGRFLRDNPRYADAFKATDPIGFANRIHLDGYATDPGYCDKVDSLIEKYDLRQYDLPRSGS